MLRNLNVQPSSSFTTWLWWSSRVRGRIILGTRMVEKKVWSLLSTSLWRSPTPGIGEREVSGVSYLSLYSVFPSKDIDRDGVEGVLRGRETLQGIDYVFFGHCYIKRGGFPNIVHSPESPILRVSRRSSLSYSSPWGEIQRLIETLKDLSWVRRLCHDSLTVKYLYLQDYPRVFSPCLRVNFIGEGSRKFHVY